MEKSNIPIYALEKAPAPGEREIRMRPARDSNPPRVRGGDPDELQ